ncbi:MAG: U32 family peptidase [Lysobacterales bacterium]|jgi:putative protease
MKILAPLKSVTEVSPLRAAGADEFYCGLAPPGWNEKFGQAWVNRRDPATAGVNGEEALRGIIAAAGKTPVFVTLNSPHYPPGAVEMLAHYGQYLIEELGVAALIVADMDLLLSLAEAGYAGRLHLSSLAVSTNAGSARFFRGLGLARIILPRHLTVAEIRQCVIEGIGFEAFLMNDGCVFEEGLCATTHAAGTFCLQDAEGLEGISAKLADRYAFWKWTQNNCGCNSSKGFPLGPCGLCAIPALGAAGVRSLKVVGREASAGRKLASVRLAAAARDISREGGSAAQIREAIIALRGAASLCENARACYYPDIWAGEQAAPRHKRQASEPEAAAPKDPSR